MMRRFSLFLLLACCLLGGCGGGLIAGVGSGGSGVAEGTVSGFGSVIVDGVEYSEAALALADRGALRLGQRVRLVFGADDVAQSVEVRPQLRGPVTAAPDENGWMRLAGQWVRLVQSNEDSTGSGITLIDGFTDAAIPAGEDATAYGSWAWDGSRAAYVLVATRIERLVSPADPVLLGGVAISVGASGFRLGSADGTLVSAARLPALAEGAVVAVAAARADVVAVGGTVASVQASDVQDASLGALDLSGYQTVRVGGLANGYDPNGGTLTIQGTQLRLGSDPNGAAGGMDTGFRMLAAGQFVRATAMGGAPGDLSTAAVQRRTGSPIGMMDDGSGAVTTLKGNLAGVDWSAASVAFVLRGVNVQADAAQIAASCRSTPSSQTLYVVVDGYLPGPMAPLRANSVNCSTDLAAASRDL